MGAVGVFAGRGDVILFMIVAAILGFILGWWLKSKKVQIQAWWKAR